ncbi:MAG: hypothetical protein PHT19_15565 [Methylococcus sp.]|nr:hypothetical protein [Methylococcus sp.]
MAEFIPEQFDTDERRVLFSFCSDLYFVDSLENLRAEYANILNNAKALLLRPHERDIPNAAGVAWALAQEPYDKPPTARDVKLRIDHLRQCAEKYLDAWRNTGYLEKGLLHDMGIDPGLLTKTKQSNVTYLI